MKKNSMICFALGMLSAIPVSYILMNKNKMKVNKVMDDLLEKASSLTKDYD